MRPNLSVDADTLRRGAAPAPLEIVHRAAPHRNVPVTFTLDRMADASLTFGTVSTGDGEALAALRVEAMRPSLERAGRFDPDRARQRFLASFEPEYTRDILASGVRVGFFVLKPTGEGLVLDHLYVQPSHQGRGIGAAVLRSVFAEADSRCLDVRVGALKGSDSNRFYVRHGFVMESQADFDNYYVRRPGDAI